MIKKLNINKYNNNIINLFTINDNLLLCNKILIYNRLYEKLNKYNLLIFIKCAYGNDFQEKPFILNNFNQINLKDLNFENFKFEFLNNKTLFNYDFLYGSENFNYLNLESFEELLNEFIFEKNYKKSELNYLIYTNFKNNLKFILNEYN